MIIAMKHLVIIYDGEPFNFQMVFNGKYKRYYGSFREAAHILISVNVFINIIMARSGKPHIF